MSKAELYLHQHMVDRKARSGNKGHLPLVIWLTGLSGSGKSTIANALEYRLVFEYGAHTYLLDGDNIRSGLNAGLGFSDEDRRENIRRIGEVAKLMFDAGLIVITAFISPFREDREMVRGLFQPGEFYEVYVTCPLDKCKERDPKGLYRKAMKGEIKEFTGISSPYEPPLSPDIIVNTDIYNAEECVEKILSMLLEKHIIRK